MSSDVLDRLKGTLKDPETGEDMDPAAYAHWYVADSADAVRMIEDLQRALETGVKTPSYAPSDHDVVVFDRHGFAYRARRNIHGIWSLFGNSRVPIFTDSDLVGWIALPRAVRDYDYDNGGPS